MMACLFLWPCLNDLRSRLKASSPECALMTEREKTIISLLISQIIDCRFGQTQGSFEGSQFSALKFKPLGIGEIDAGFKSIGES